MARRRLLPASDEEKAMRFLPELDPQTLDLLGLTILFSQDLVSAVLLILDRCPLLEDGMEILGRPVL